MVFIQKSARKVRRFSFLGLNITFGFDVYKFCGHRGKLELYI
jgi:hypothetical protein